LLTTVIAGGGHVLIDDAALPEQEFAIPGWVMRALASSHPAPTRWCWPGRPRRTPAAVGSASWERTRWDARRARRGVILEIVDEVYLPPATGRRPVISKHNDTNSSASHAFSMPTSTTIHALIP
jgi:hypothetical protein